MTRVRTTSNTASDGFNSTGFNSTSGFSRKAVPFDGHSLVPTSPFRPDGEVWAAGAREVAPDRSNPTMGFVGSGYRVRIACEHWAPEGRDDCRYGCEAAAQTARFVP